MTRSRAAVLLLLSMALLGACANDPAAAPPGDGSTSAASTPNVASEGVTRCKDVRLPREGLGEADFATDREAGLLTINFSDMRRGKYRNVTYTIAYRDDPTCVTDMQMAEVIARTSASR